MDEKNVGDEQCQVALEIENYEEAAESESTVDGAETREVSQPTKIDFDEAELKLDEASATSRDPSTDEIVSSASFHTDIKQTVQESTAECWATFEPNLKSLLSEISDKLRGDMIKVVGQSTSELGQRLKPDFDSISSVPERIDRSLNGFISAILDRIEDPRGQFALNLQRSLLKGLLGLYDLLQDLERDGDKVLSDKEHRANYHTLRTQLLQLLMFSDVKLVLPEAGTEMDAQYHRVLEVVPTAEPEADNCIESCIRDGFTYGSIVLRPAEVSVKKYSAEAERALTNHTMEEEG